MWNYFRLAVWACIWMLLWILTAPFRKGRDNCLTWALRQQRKHGGYLVIRWSATDKNVPEHLKHPHFAWLPPEAHIHTHHYFPKEGRNEDLIPDLWFEGIVEKGDRHVEKVPDSPWEKMKKKLKSWLS